MIPENTSLLIEKLKNSTLSNQITWTKTSRENEFKLALVKGSITTDLWSDEDDDLDAVDFAILNMDGDVIERLVFTSTPKEKIYYNSLVELHKVVKRSFYKVDETIQLLLNEVEHKANPSKDAESATRV